MNLPETHLLRQIRSNLKAIRTTRHLSPAEVFLATGIHIETFEKDSSDIELPVLEKLCAFYQVPMSDFFKTVEHFEPMN